MNKKKYKYHYKDDVLVGRTHKKTKLKQHLCTDGTWTGITSQTKNPPTRNRIRVLVEMVNNIRSLRIMQCYPKSFNEAEIALFKTKLMLLGEEGNDSTSATNFIYGHQSN